MTASKPRNGHFDARDVSVKMVLTRRTAALDRQQLKEKTREPERCSTEEEEGKGDCTEHEKTETHPDHTAWVKEDRDSSTEREQMDKESLRSLTASACSILRKARVDGRTGHLDSSDEETEEDCMETEDLPSSFISLSGVDLVEGKSVKRKRMKQKLVTHDVLPTCADHVS